MAKYRMNRAVGIMSKGDEFHAETDDPAVVSLVGAGYADRTLEDDDVDQVRGESDHDADRATPLGFTLQPNHGEHDHAGKSEDRTS